MAERRDDTTDPGPARTTDPGTGPELPAADPLAQTSVDDPVVDLLLGGLKAPRFPRAVEVSATDGELVARYAAGPRDLPASRATPVQQPSVMFGATMEMPIVPYRPAAPAAPAPVALVDQTPPSAPAVSVATPGRFAGPRNALTVRIDRVDEALPRSWTGKHLAIVLGVSGCLLLGLVAIGFLLLRGPQLPGESAQHPASPPAAERSAPMVTLPPPAMAVPTVAPSAATAPAVPPVASATAVVVPPPVPPSTMAPALATAAQSAPSRPAPRPAAPAGRLPPPTTAQPSSDSILKE